MFSKGPLFNKLHLLEGTDSKLFESLSKKEFIVFVLKFSAAILLIGFGIVLIWLGVDCDSNSHIELKYGDELTVTINDAMPGVILAIFGAILLLLSRMNIKISRK